MYFVLARGRVCVQHGVRNDNSRSLKKKGRKRPFSLKKNNYQPRQEVGKYRSAIGAVEFGLHLY